MNQFHREQSQIRYSLDNFICEVCGKKATQSAHRIGQTKLNIKKYGESVIHSNLNLVSVCSLKCNGKVNVGFNKNDLKDRLHGLILIHSDDYLSTKKVNQLLGIEW